MDQKKSNPIGGLQGTGQSASATSLTLSHYAVPSLDGRLLQAIPIQMALKFRPPTIAVIYKMKDNKTLKMKKYIHEILITFPDDTESIDVNRMCDEICRKETTYLNPAFISK
jgi:hypothetical protein